MKHLLERNGWHVKIDKGGIPYWEEDEPQYKLPCPQCNSTGKTTDHHQDCMGLCMCPSSDCIYCNGIGARRSAPLNPMPDRAIIDRLHDALAQTVLDFKVIFDNGKIEASIAEDKAKEDSLKGACL